MNAIIMPDVVIGDRCVIGVGSLVTKDVPSGEVWAGVPARFICTTEEYCEKLLSKMPETIPEGLDGKKERTLYFANERRRMREENKG